MQVYSLTGTTHSHNQILVWLSQTEFRSIMTLIRLLPQLIRHLRHEASLPEMQTR